MRGWASYNPYPNLPINTPINGEETIGICPFSIDLLFSHKYNR